MTEFELGDLADVSDDAAALRLYADRMAALSEQMRAIRVTETSADGAVTATVDGEGGLTDMCFSTAISRMTPDEFASCVVETSHAAARRAMHTQADLVGAFNEASSDSFPVSENSSGPAQLT